MLPHYYVVLKSKSKRQQKGRDLINLINRPRNYYNILINNYNVHNNNTVHNNVNNNYYGNNNYASERYYALFCFRG